MKANLITSSENMRYIAGYTGEGTILMTDNEKILYADGRYTIQAHEECPDFEVITTNNYVDEIKKKHIFRMGIEKSKMTIDEFHRLKHRLHFRSFNDISEELSQMRIIKDEKEIACIARAAEIANSGLEHIRNFIKAGMSEKECALELEFFMRKAGADGLSFDTIVASGAHAAMAHASVTESLIPNNTYVLIDFGCKYNGYCSDMTRMVKIGEPPEEMQKIYGIVLKAQEAGLAMVKAGARAGDVDKAARDVIKAAGYGDKFVHSTGHGVGLDIHEEPRVSARSEDILEPGMVVTVEPGIYIDGLGGVRIEDMVMVTEDGYRNFSIKEK